MGELIRLKSYRKAPTPLVLVTGLPGSGKSTLIQKLALSRPDLRILTLAEPDLTRVKNLCKDCNLYHLVDEALAQGMSTGDYDLVFIEASGDCDPRLLAETVLTTAEDKPELTGRLRLDRIINVVDLSRFWEDLEMDLLLRERRTSWLSGLKNPFASDEESSVIDVLTANAELCDVIVTTHGEGLRPLDFKDAQGALKCLQDRAPILPLPAATPVDFDLIMHKAPGFDETATENGSAWRVAFTRLPYDNTDDSLEKTMRLESGVEAYVYRRRRPFHPQRIYTALENFWPHEGVLRSFGQLWLAIPGETAFAFSSTGPEALRFWPDGKWIAARSTGERSERMVVDADLRASWDGRLGDRFTEILVLGYNLDIPMLRETLDSCLVDELEFKRDWTGFENPFKEFAVTETPLPQ